MAKEENSRELIAALIRIQKRAHAPYSNYRVACILTDEKGNRHEGCNVENASYSATLCAERVALGNLVSSGARRVERVALITPSSEPCFPCGVCLQALSEFSKDAPVLAFSSGGKRSARSSLRELLPEGFSKKKMGH